MSKKQITIGEVYETSAAVCVPYEFDTGEHGQLNFPLGTSNEDIVRALKDIYEKTQQLKKQPKPDRSKLKDLI